jgi:hypothetical protein
MSMKGLLNYELMDKEAAAWAEDYAKAEPYPHIALDGIINDSALREGLAAFPDPRDISWFNCVEKEGELKSKQAIWELRKMPDPLARIMMELTSGPFVEFLEKLAGIPELVADCHLYGAGLHQIGRGGSLGIHCDHNINPRVSLYRRVSVILYLNDDWKEEYGGTFEMWSPDMKRCVKQVTPSFNRMLIFSNSETSFHGHPDPLMCPPDVTRKSIAAYFDSIHPHPSYAPSHHRALFQARPGEKEQQRQ